VTELLAGTAPSWSPDGKRIAFTGDSGIVLMNADGNGVTRFDGAFGYPVWSPDGTRFLLVCGSHDLCTMNVDGTGLAKLPLEESICGKLDPAWSRDGSAIVYSLRFCNGGPQIMMMNADGIGGVVLTSSGGDVVFHDEHPQFRP
jgi:Tol biopolymer transport system component